MGRKGKAKASKKSLSRSLVRKGGISKSGEDSMMVDAGSGAVVGGGGKKKALKASLITKALSMEQNNIKLAVEGIPKDTELSSLLNFLGASTNNGFVPEEVFMPSKTRVIIAVQNAREAALLEKVSGSQINGATLRIRRLKAAELVELKRAPDGVPQHLTPLRDYIMSVYSGMDGMVDLSGIKDKVPGVANLNNGETVKVLLTIVKNLSKTPVTTISLAGNQIRSLFGFGQIHDFLPNVVHLSLDNNMIKSIKELDYLRALKIRELSLIGNPVKESVDNTVYRTELQRKFQTMTVLDREPCRPIISFDLPTHITTPATVLPTIAPGFVESGAIQAAAEQFVVRYFQVYDDNRASLAVLYDPTAFVSLSSNFPEGEDGKGLTRYAKWNRNFKRLSDNAKRTSSIRFQQQQIMDMLTAMPSTKHDLSSLFCDAYLMKPAGTQILCINAHGSFGETDAKGNASIMRSFDRTFLLMPPAPGSDAANMGIDMVIINEHIHIRPFRTPVVLPPPGAKVEVQALPANTLVEQLSRQTGLRPEAAFELLTSAMNNMDAAMAEFQQLQAAGMIPAEYFAATSHV